MWTDSVQPRNSTQSRRSVLQRHDEEAPGLEAAFWCCKRWTERSRKDSLKACFRGDIRGGITFAPRPDWTLPTARRTAAWVEIWHVDYFSKNRLSSVTRCSVRVIVSPWLPDLHQCNVRHGGEKLWKANMCLIARWPSLFPCSLLFLIFKKRTVERKRSKRDWWYVALNGNYSKAWKELLSTTGLQ